MVKPQQPDLVPEANAPGHHPDHEQDKPSGRDFAAKSHALAESEGYEPPTPENEVLDVTQVEGDEMHDVPPPKAAPTTPVERAVGFAGKSLGIGFTIAGAVIRQVRRRLP